MSNRRKQWGNKNCSKYEVDFKRNAVLLSLENGRSVKAVAENFGIHKDLIHEWRKKYDRLGEIVFPGHGIFENQCEKLTKTA